MGYTGTGNEEEGRGLSGSAQDRIGCLTMAGLQYGIRKEIMLRGIGSSWAGCPPPPPIVAFQSDHRAMKEATLPV